jgi:uncharacterized membrane protein HdeD (DUF308 family)
MRSDATKSCWQRCGVPIEDLFSHPPIKEPFSTTRIVSRKPGPLVSASANSGPLARYTWWVFLATGISGIVVGVVTLATTPDSVVTLAKIAGVAFLFDALLLGLLASQAQEWNGFYLLGALTAIAGVALLLSSDGSDRSRIAIILGAGLALRGLIDGLVAWGGITDFTEASSALWEWILLIVGIITLLLGVAALIVRGGSTSTLLVVVGFAVLARGIGMVAISYRLRALT